MTTLGKDPFDLSVGKIDFVVLRKPDMNWALEHMTNHSYFILVFVFSGQASYEFGGKQHTVGAGDILFFQKGQLHSAVSAQDDPWCFCSSAFDLTFYSDEARAAIQCLPTLLHVSSARCADRFRELFNVWNRRADGFMLKCRSLIGDLLYLLIQNTQAELNDFPHNRTLEKIKTYIAEHVSEPLPIEQLAKLADLSPSHFRMLFKQYTGLTTVQYQNQLRIGRACSLLRSGECNVTEAAYTVGFSDIYYFSRLFKKLTGITPSSYTKQ